jgi:hypothetical protein
MIPEGAAAHRAVARQPLALCALAVTLVVSAAHAGEPLYVIEQLVVEVNSAPGGTGSKVGTLKSGDRVELLDRQGDEAQIQLPSGASGWVKASYLSSELPLQRRLQDRTAEVEKLKQDVSHLESRLAARAALGPVGAGAAPPVTATAPPAGAVPPPATATAPPGVGAVPPAMGTVPPGAPSGGAATATPAGGGPSHGPSAAAGPPPQSGDPPPYLGPADPLAEPPWVWILTCSACALAIGFVAGWRVLDRRIRRKYGGLRIY